MDWILIITLLLNGVEHTVEVKPMTRFFCERIAESVSKKHISIDSSTATILSATCVSK